MNRADMIRQMTDRRFDLLVIGGGITGAGVAREAALRGLSVALVEGHDFAYGTSSRSTKLIHGGLRYLKNLNFKLVRESVKERQRLLQMAPHLVKVTRFAFPVYAGDPDGLLKLRLGLTLYDWFAGSSNPLPHRILSPDNLLEEEPGLARQGLRGGGVYCDCTTDDGRLTLETIRSAAEHGTVLANYLQVEGFLYGPGGDMVGAKVRDSVGEDLLEVQAEKVLAAAGPWADHLRRLDDPEVPSLLRLTKGVHVTVKRERLPVRGAVVMRGTDTRMMFAVPAGPFTYLGTTDTDYSGEPGAVRADGGDVAYILAAANQIFPERRLSEADVVSTWAGLRPLIRPHGSRSPSETSRDYALYSSASGLVTVAGGKLTAFRAMASHIVDDLFPRTHGSRHLEQSSAPLPGAAGPLATADEIRRLAARTGATQEQVEYLAERYGTAFAAVAKELPDPGAGPERAWLIAQTRYSVHKEMATRLEDVLARRTGALLFSEGNGCEHLEALAAEMGALLGWTQAHLGEEVRRCRQLIDTMFGWKGARGSITAQGAS